SGDDQVDVFIELEKLRDECAVGRFDKLDRVLNLFVQRLPDDPHDRLIRMKCLFSPTEDDRVSALDAQGRRVAGDVWATLIEEQNHADWHTAFFDTQTVGADVAFYDLTDRIDLLGDLLNAGSHRFDALLIQFQPLDQGGRELKFLGFGDI